MSRRIPFILGLYFLSTFSSPLFLGKGWVNVTCATQERNVLLTRWRFETPEEMMNIIQTLSSPEAGLVPCHPFGKAKKRGKAQPFLEDVWEKKEAAVVFF